MKRTVYFVPGVSWQSSTQEATLSPNRSNVSYSFYRNSELTQARTGIFVGFLGTRQDIPAQ